ACGTTIPAGMAFCPQCGADRAGNVAPPQGQPAYPPSTVPMGPVPFPRMRISMGLLIALLGLILVVTAMAMFSWFVIEISEEGYDMTQRFGLRKLEITSEGFGEPIKETASYTELTQEMEDQIVTDDVVRNTWWTLLMGVIVAAFFILFAFLALLGIVRGTVTWVPVLTGLVAGILIVVATSYFAIAFQDALEEDMGQELTETEGSSFGIGAAWYLALVGGILILLSALLTKVPSAYRGQMVPMQ
ncbi:MAG: hypothetical protein JSW25_04490, partial [Thermoplasmata archaeon]